MAYSILVISKHRQRIL